MVEREWREASDLRTSRIALAIVLVAAAVLRYWAIGRGIPYAVQIDEPEIDERAFNMMRSGSLHPHFYDYQVLSPARSAASGTRSVRRPAPPSTCGGA